MVACVSLDLAPAPVVVRKAGPGSSERPVCARRVRRRTEVDIRPRTDDARVHLQYVRDVSRLWSFMRRHGVDVVIVIGALVGALEVVFTHEARLDLQTSRWFAAPATACVALALLARRRFPFAAPAAMWVLAALLSFVEGQLVVAVASLYVAGTAASFLLGNVADVARARLGLAIVLGAASLVIYNSPDQAVGDFLFVPGFMAIAWFAGFALRERSGQAEAAQQRATQAEREREETARRAVFEERVRIARELHDVVAHHVSMMGVQAGAARMIVDRDRGKAKDALAAIETSSRQAVDELHRLLGFLRQAGETDDLAPSPGVSQLPGLVTGMRESDLAVEMDVEGEERPLPPTVDVSAYRIVQEALTNTLKHAGASRADVRLRYAPGELELEIIDDGRGASDRSQTGSGLGLIGMRERAALHGGQLTAGPVSGGGFAVRVRLPTSDRAT
ncbi:MAG TPA: sensor histidine kinase [Solirubrobacteraceae bacterium]|nr:sensor histidine kinase [Solirubrobacteraceae bacterium]